MITGRDFLILGIELGRGRSEAVLRTAVGRAYYGAFHLARDILDRTGIILPSGPESHRKVQLCLLECGETAARRAGNRLEALRTIHNAADYDLQGGHYSQADVALQMAIAQEIAAALAALSAEPSWSRFREKARHYADKVLRLPLRG